MIADGCRWHILGNKPATPVRRQVFVVLGDSQINNGYAGEGINVNDCWGWQLDRPMRPPPDLPRSHRKER